MKCAIFDKDGTLIDFEAFWIPVARKAIDEICKPYKMDTQMRKDVLKSIGIGETVNILGPLCYGTYTDIANAIYNTLLLGNVKCEKEYLLNITHDAFSNALNEGTLKPTSKNLKATLKKLKDSGTLLVVVTADTYDMTKYCLEKIEIFDLFDEILTDDGIHPLKPDPYYIEYLKDKYGLKKEDMSMVGYTLADMKFANNGHIRAYGVGEDEKNRKILSEFADLTARNVEELYGKNTI